MWREQMTAQHENAPVKNSQEGAALPTSFTTEEHINEERFPKEIKGNRTNINV